MASTIYYILAGINSVYKIDLVVWAESHSLAQRLTTRSLISPKKILEQKIFKLLI
jgi:hypothetical protein